MRMAGTLISAGVMAGLLTAPVCAQQQARPDNASLGQRVAALEQYVQTLPPTMKRFTRDMFDSMRAQIRSQTGQVVGLDPFSKKVSKIETNTGTFLISIRKVEREKDGYRLSINIGNPSLATYNGVTLKLMWGQDWSPDDATVSYNQWRSSLRGAEYKFSGDLSPGAWTTFMLDVKPVDRKHFQYLECEMNVETVSLKQEGE